MSEESKLSETVPESLLDEREVFQVSISAGERTISEYETAVKLESPWEFDGSKFIPNQTVMSLDRFFEIASDIISDAQDRESIADGQEKVRLIEAYPPEDFSNFDNEVICFRVLRREPAKMNPSGTGRPQRKSRFSHDLQDPRLPNKSVVVESRPIDHLIEFSCWAKTNKIANKRALWLEKLFVTHSWAFEVQGVERFFWKDRGPDTFMTSGGQRLFYRPINFFVRFSEFEIRTTPLLRTLQFNIGVES
jgi:hypothetical protein